MNSSSFNCRDCALHWLASYAYQYRPDNPFVLASGAISEDYLDCKLALSNSEALCDIGKFVSNHLMTDIVAVGGLTMGADPIAIAASFASAKSMYPKRWFSVRKNNKDHGTHKIIEGDVHEGDTVAIVDDVCTSGNSTITAIEACRDAGLVVRQVIVLVDREQDNGMENIRQKMGPGIGLGRVISIFTKNEIHQKWLSLHQNP